MNKLIKRRAPTYLAGFLFGLMAVMAIVQVKKAVAPAFADFPDKRSPITIGAGGFLRLKLGEEPGKVLAWGFPTRLAVGLRGGAGRVEPLITLEYRHLVEKEVLVGPLTLEGDYELVAHFYVCDYPGEKYCGRLMLEQAIKVTAAGKAPAETPLVVDLKAVAEKASQARPIPQ